MYNYVILSTESERMEFLSQAIAKYLENEGIMAEVRRFKHPGLRDGYCQFTGGGDVYIDNQEMSMIITNHQEDPSVSPRNDSDHMSGTVEGKKSDVEITKLKYQLFANTIVNCVTSFTTRCKEKYDEDFIRRVNQLIGYGVAYSGAGHAGFYKLPCPLYYKTLNEKWCCLLCVRIMLLQCDGELAAICSATCECAAG